MEHFSKVFTSSSPTNDAILKATSSIPISVTQEMVNHLEAPYSEEEVRIALNQMFPTKAPGPDEFPSLFYQHFWNNIKDKTVRWSLSVLNEKAYVESQNHTNIVLIPKRKNPKEASDYRPISLCNVSYKIIAKVLANRLKPILRFVISEFQSAFVPNRLISDNILVSYECVEKIMQNKLGKRSRRCCYEARYE